jgi:hypothetical protein
MEISNSLIIQCNFCKNFKNFNNDNNNNNNNNANNMADDFNNYSVQFSSILYYLCAESTAKRPITDTARFRYR